MGFNTWNHFGCNIQEDLIRKTADVIVSSGLKDAGYNYINLDDCWQVARTPDTNEIIPDPKAFPSGIKALADYVHSKGLKFGVYSDAGTNTCAGRPGSLGFETIDAQSYAKWGVDYLKYDNCFNKFISPKTRYPPMRDALNKTGRPILFSMCEWGREDPAKWAPAVGNSWRTTPDIRDEWGSFLNILELNDRWAAYAGPGGWNDPDMLEVGNGGMKTHEYVAHFTLWALIKSPLLIGCDVTNMSTDTYTILTNRELIAWNQDPLGVQGRKVARVFASPQAEPQEVWAGPLVNGAHAVVLFNRDTKNATVKAFWKDIGVPNGKKMKARDVWLHKELGVFQDVFAAQVAAHSVVAVTLTPA